MLVYLVGATLTLITACLDLVSTLAERTPATGGAFALLGDAVLTWGTSILTFTVWYWFLDQGGPTAAQCQPGPPDFAFPQQTASLPGWERWTPGLLDYLFVAFDTRIQHLAQLTRWSCLPGLRSCACCKRASLL